MKPIVITLFFCCSGDIFSSCSGLGLHDPNAFNHRLAAEYYDIARSPYWCSYRHSACDANHQCVQLLQLC